MKLKGISDKGIKRIAQDRPSYNSEEDIYRFVDEALSKLAAVDEDLLSDAGVEMLNAAYGAVWEFQRSLDDVVKSVV